MTALYIILGIIAFFMILLYIRCTVIFEYTGDVNLWVKWLFIKIRILPLTPKQKQKKEAKEAKEAEKKAEPEPAQPAADSPPAEKKPSMLKDLWKTHGYDGLVKMLKDTLAALKSFAGGCVASFVIDELYYNMRVSSGDAAQTATDYGKYCAELFPLFGGIVNRMKVKKYDVNIYPDFLATSNCYHMKCTLHFRPLYMVNATLALTIKLLFKVVLKVLFKKPKGNENIKNVQNISKGGATQ